jgi:hypothetical protein
VSYIVWIIENDEPRIVEIKKQLPSGPIMGQNLNYIHSYLQFEGLIGKKEAAAALRRYHAQPRRRKRQHGETLSRPQWVH